jgi:hypothetical protein
MRGATLCEHPRHFAGVKCRKVRRTHREASSWIGCAGDDLAMSNRFIETRTGLDNDLDSRPCLKFGAILAAATYDNYPLDVSDGKEPFDCVVKHRHSHFATQCPAEP